MNKVLPLFRQSQTKPTVAFNMRPVRGPWGGSSVFVSQMERYAKQRGCRVVYSLNGHVDLIVLIDPREDLQSKAFGMPEIIQYRKDHPRVSVVHRVNECDLRKNSTFMDPQLAAASEHVDFTVFISEWLRDHHAEKWFDKSRPHNVVYNGADTGAFNPFGSAEYSPGETFRLVTHHWADSRIKGFDEYEQVDHMIAAGELKGVQLVVAGRWPGDMEWKSAELHGPLKGQALANVLKTCHGYITASKWEPCGMHHVEGAQCGLPVVYHEDGGGIVEACKRYGCGFREDPKSAVEELITNYTRYRSQLFDCIPSGDAMCLGYWNVFQKLICRSGSNV